jgi:hypothetical protein
MSVSSILLVAVAAQPSLLFAAALAPTMSIPLAIHGPSG